MASYIRILTRWSGGPGGTGLTVMNCRYTSGAVTASTAAVRAFWNALTNDIPSVYSAQVDGPADIHDSDTGALTGTATGTTPAANTFIGSGNFAGGVGAQVKWTTGTVHAGHRVQGRTFVVPLVVGRYFTDGTLDNSWVTSANSAAATLLSALSSAGTPLAIFSLPSSGSPLGNLADVTAGAAVDRVATLRSRRR